MHLLGFWSVLGLCIRYWSDKEEFIMAFYLTWLHFDGWLNNQVTMRVINVTIEVEKLTHWNTEGDRLSRCYFRVAYRRAQVGWVLVSKQRICLKDGWVQVIHSNWQGKKEIKGKKEKEKRKRRRKSKREYKFGKKILSGRKELY